MRASPPIEVELRPDVLWMLSVGALACVSIAGIATCIFTGDGTVPLPAQAGAAALAALAAGLALSSLRPRRGHLRWSGARWQLASSTDPASQPTHGAVTVALDLGAWMLLRFEAEPSGSGRVVWLPMGRGAQVRLWHGLRCAVYGRRPDPDA